MVHFRYRSRSKSICPENSSAARSASWLGPGLHVKGSIVGAEDLRLDGTVEGTIQLDEHTLTIGSDAQVTADINAQDVVVYGYLKGNVRATGRIEVKKVSSVFGNLTTTQIIIEDDADFKGSIGTDDDVTEVLEKNIPRKAAAAAAGYK